MFRNKLDFWILALPAARQTFRLFVQFVKESYGNQRNDKAFNEVSVCYVKTRFPLWWLDTQKFTGVTAQ